MTSAEQGSHRSIETEFSDRSDVPAAPASTERHGTERSDPAVGAPGWSGLAGLPRLPLIALALGCIAIIIPTMASVARDSWSTEQGGHGPIVLASGLWLLSHMWPAARAVFQQPPAWRVGAALLLLLPAYFLARVCGIVEIEAFTMYGLLLTALYSAIGGRAMARLKFPLFYLAFTFPPPDSVIFFLTMPLKSLISHAAVEFLGALGYPIGGAGVVIVIGQYELLIAAACSGLNSIITLSALSLFYVYIRHQAEPVYALLLTMTVIPIALFANFIRVLILILLTYYGGEAAGQGFMHSFAGVVMFIIALGTVLALDAVGIRIWQHFRPVSGRVRAGLSGTPAAEARHDPA